MEVSEATCTICTHVERAYLIFGVFPYDKLLFDTEYLWRVTDETRSAEMCSLRVAESSRGHIQEWTAHQISDDPFLL